MIATEFTAAHNGHTNSFALRAERHSLFIPFAAPFGSATGNA